MKRERFEIGPDGGFCADLGALRSVTDQKMGRWRFLFQVGLLVVGLTVYLGFVGEDWDRRASKGSHSRPELPFSGATVKKIYYVNLDETADRRRFMDRQLAAQPARFGGDARLGALGERARARERELFTV